MLQTNKKMMKKYIRKMGKGCERTIPKRRPKTITMKIRSSSLALAGDAHLIPQRASRRCSPERPTVGPRQHQVLSGAWKRGTLENIHCYNKPGGIETLNICAPCDRASSRYLPQGSLACLPGYMHEDTQWNTDLRREKQKHVKRKINELVCSISMEYYSAFEMNESHVTIQV